LSNPTIVTVPQPHREAPQLSRYDKSSPQCIVSQKSLTDINSDDENCDLGHKDNTEVVKENGRVISEYKLRKDVEYNRQNLITSPSYLHENNKIELESEMICPPPPPVPYGTLRYNSFVNTGNQVSNNVEKSTTPSSNVESSCGNSISSNSIVLPAYQNDENKQHIIIDQLENNMRPKPATSSLVYNHIFKSKISNPSSTCNAWNGDVLLHESPTANSSSSSSYIPPVSKETIDGNHMDSGL